MIEKIKNLIEKENLNYSEVAKIVGIHRTTVSKICKNNNIKKNVVIFNNCKICDKYLGENKRNDSKCKSCTTKLRRFRLKRKAVEYLGGKCIRCGYNDNLSALTFHHRVPEEKDFGIGEFKHKSWKYIKPELDKCDLLCANCHHIEHSSYDDEKLIKWVNEYGKSGI